MALRILEGLGHTLMLTANLIMAYGARLALAEEHWQHSSIARKLDMSLVGSRCSPSDADFARAA